MSEISLFQDGAMVQLVAGHDVRDHLVT